MSNAAEGAFGAMRWPAPAKINRFLHITGRRPDGYHELQTLFQFLDWGDELEIALRQDGLIQRSHGDAALAAELAVEEDLSLRAARALQSATGCRLGADIAVHKRIPLGAGLGGGSSDAATVLVALNRLWQCDLDAGALAAIGLQLGADVPVFIHGQACWAEGIGERLDPVSPEEQWLLLALPAATVATAAAYAHPALRRDCPRVTPEDFAAGRCGNVFEPVARALAPEVDAAMRALAEAAASEGLPEQRPQLSGSGGACFLPIPDRATGRRLQARLPTTLRTVLSRAQNRSPLHLACQGALGR
jgi:4-diphosphocytidyl-2-C-methyl-D-erythritol kinase